MNPKDKLPKEVLTVIDKTVEGLEKKCYPCKVIFNGTLITERKIITDEQLAEKASDSLKKLAQYIFAKGVLEGEELQKAKNKDMMLQFYQQKVRYVEVRIDKDGNVLRF